MANPIRAEVPLSLEKQTSPELDVSRLPTVSQVLAKLELSRCLTMELGVAGSRILGQCLSFQSAVGIV